MEESEQKSREQLWGELLDVINRQLAMNNKIKEVMVPSTGASSRRKKIALTDEAFDNVRELFIELEALQAEGRAIYHTLFGTEEE